MKQHRPGIQNTGINCCHKLLPHGEEWNCCGVMCERASRICVDLTKEERKKGREGGRERGGKGGLHG